MTDDLFLKFCYFGMGILSILLGLGVYLLLRRSFTEVALNTTPVQASRFMGRLFLFGMVVTSFSGFLSVSMPGCNNRRYEQIVSDRAYILGKVRNQASSSMLYVVDGLLASGLVIALLLSSNQRDWSDRSRASNSRVQPDVAFPSENSGGMMNETGVVPRRGGVKERPRR